MILNNGKIYFDGDQHKYSGGVYLHTQPHQFSLSIITLMNNLQSAILELLQNYVQCEYPLSLEQIQRMLTVKVSRKELNETLQRMRDQQLITSHETRHWYTIRGHEITFRRREERVVLSKNKQAILDKFVNLLCDFPGINTVILTGSLALDNAKVSDDIDLMIITAPDTMFICRLYVFVLAKILGLARKRSVETQPDAICVNIWLDGSNLVVPISKVSVYSAREIVNVRVIIDRNSMFDDFIYQNRWIDEKLPNWEYQIQNTKSRVPSAKIQTSKTLTRFLNGLLGRAQLWYMRPHITNEIVGITQLWFHPKLRY